jgi:hypothetical protein
MNEQHEVAMLTGIFSSVAGDQILVCRGRSDRLSIIWITKCYHEETVSTGLARRNLAC